MPRMMGNVTNELKIFDPQTSETVSLFYRKPTNKEKATWQAKAVKMSSAGGSRKTKFEVMGFEEKLEIGLTLLVGIQEGYFVRGDLAISSQPGTTGYCPDWKSIIAEEAGELIVSMADYVFGGARIADDDEKGGENTTKNFPTSSTDTSIRTE